jgi:hypothetical protein
LNYGDKFFIRLEYVLSVASVATPPVCCAEEDPPLLKIFPGVLPAISDPDGD